MSFKVFGIAPTSVVLRVKLFDSATGQGKTGMDHTEALLRISAIQQGWGANGEATPAVYIPFTSDVETIATLGTYQAPSDQTKCRFKEVDPNNHPGVYEIHFNNSRFALTSDSTKPMTLLVSISGVTGMSQQDLEIECGSTSHAVWDTLYVLHTNSGTFGEYFFRMMSGIGNRVTMYLRQLNIVATGDDSAIDATGSGLGAGQKNTGGAEGEGVMNTGGSNKAGQKNLGGANEAGQINQGGAGGGPGQLNYGPAGVGCRNQGSNSGQENTSTGSQPGQKNISTGGPGMENSGGTNSDGMKNTGAGTGKDISAPINDLGLNNGTALTAQQVRDAMKLAPAGGDPAAGSVDEHLDDVKTAVDGQFPELTGPVGATPTLKQLLMRLYMKVANKETAARSSASAGVEKVYKNDGTAIIQKIYADTAGTTTVEQETAIP